MDIYEPLSRYLDEFREKFATLCTQTFQELFEKSGVDEKENQLLVRKIDHLKQQRNAAESKRSFYKFMIFLMILFFFGGLALAVYYILEGTGKQEQQYCIIGGFIAALVAALLFFCKFLPAVRSASARIEMLNKEIQENISLAWEQMKPLNRLFSWRTTVSMIEKCIPGIFFDHSLTENRLYDLIQTYGWDNTYNDDKSVVFSHSGTINGNPFVFAKLRYFEWIMKTYTGTKRIHWTTRERDSDGKVRTVHHSETLVATVEKPYPMFLEDKMLIYGNEAAPSLTFSREPSDLSNSGKGFFASIKRWSRLRKLKKFARNLDDESQFTMMSNENFELLFHAIDRNDEVEFRLLFTPLAQLQMVKLLEDEKVGYGDDFTFRKLEKINVIHAQHLNETDFNTAPDQFCHYDLAYCKKHFMEFNNEFFKSIYFSLAPLLTVPLYQQPRSVPVAENTATDKRASFWEYEALANYYGSEYFQHTECVTQNILKTKRINEPDDSTVSVAVTAHGFRSEEHFDVVPVYGGDGRFHDVVVPWDKYIAVARTRMMNVAEFSGENEPDPDLLEAFRQQTDSVRRNTLLAYLDQE